MSYKRLCIGLMMQGGRTWAGGAEYIKNIVLALSKLPEDTKKTFQLKVICSEQIESEFIHTLAPGVESIHYLDKEQLPLTPFNRIKWKIKKELLHQEKPRVDEFVRQLGIDFVYPYFSSKSKKLSVRSSPWIPDFQHKYLPQYFSQDELQRRDNAFSNIANFSESLVVSSEAAASDFYRFFPTSKCNVHVLSFRTVLPEETYQNDPVAIQKKYHLPDRFFLVSNQFWQHKNHSIIFEALRQLHGQNIYPTLVCTGHLYDRRYPKHADKILELIHTYGLAKQVFLLGMIPRPDQIQLMRRAIAVIQPSLFEGWSTVVEDARCLGKKMLLSDFPVHIEQNPPDSHFFERDSVEALAQLVGKQWHSGSVGPESSREIQARVKSEEDVQRFGQRFLEIARLCSRI